LIVVRRSLLAAVCSSWGYIIRIAIAVLIVAFLGIALWQGFDGMVTSATTKTRAQVEQIGR